MLRTVLRPRRAARGTSTGRRSRSRRSARRSTASACGPRAGPRREVLAHADLLAVEHHRRARQGEQQAVDQPDPALVAVEHRRQPPAQPAAVELHVLVRPERGEDLLALVVGQLVQGQLVVVAHEGRPLRISGELRPLLAAPAPAAPRRRGPATGTVACMLMKSKQHRRARRRPRPPKNCTAPRTAGSPRRAAPPRRCAGPGTRAGRAGSRAGRAARPCPRRRRSRAGTARRPPGTRTARARSQKPMIRAISSRTCGFATFRSGWCL